jgi:hypothetical protein
VQEEQETAREVSTTTISHHAAPNPSDITLETTSLNAITLEPTNASASALAPTGSSSALALAPPLTPSNMNDARRPHLHSFPQGLCRHKARHQTRA